MEAGQITEYYTHITGTHALRRGTHAVSYTSVQTGILPWVQCTNKLENNDKNSYDWELHPVDKCTVMLCHKNIPGVFLLPTQVNTQEAQERYGWMNIFIYQVMNTLYHLTHTHTYKTVLAQTVEQVQRDCSASVAKTPAWLTWETKVNIFTFRTGLQRRTKMLNIIYIKKEFLIYSVD